MDPQVGAPFTAILLAAGKGKRIRGLTDQPKCLLDFQGETLLARHLRVWREVGIERVVLVVGYKSELLLAAIEPFRDDFEFVIAENEDPEKLGNTVSLYLGLQKASGPVLVFDADLVYETELLADFLEAGEVSGILVGEADIGDIECAKTLADANGFARQTIDKRAIQPAELARYEFAGEAVGILKFSPADAVELLRRSEIFLAREENLALNWEHVMNQFLLERDVAVAKVDPARRWIEIDTPEDYEKALSLFQSGESRL
jgi:choline kinase